MDYRRKLIERIKLLGLPSTGKPLPLVSLEDFFYGNEDYGSIGCNIPEHPGPQLFFEILKRIRLRDDVQDVLVEINEVEESDETMWPFADRIYILTSVSKEEVEGWAAPLMPDEIEEGYAYGEHTASAPALRQGMKIYSVWWD